MAKAAGCSLFQGYYFCRPTTFSGGALSANGVAQMRLVAALNQPSASVNSIEDLLKRDSGLSYRVLRSVNSAAFGLRREVRSIREALLFLGLDQVRKLPLDSETRAALLAEDNATRTALDAVASYQQGDLASRSAGLYGAGC